MMPTTVTCYETPWMEHDANSFKGRILNVSKQSSWLLLNGGTAVPSNWQKANTNLGALSRATYYSPWSYLSGVYLEFDTSAVPPSAEITEVKLRLRVGMQRPTTSPEMYPTVFSYDWGGDPISNFPTRQTIANSTKVGHFITDDMPIHDVMNFARSGNRSMVSSVGALSSINNAGTGLTRFMVLPQAYLSTTNPTSITYSVMYVPSVHTQATEASAPMLEISYTSSGFDHLDTSSSGLVVAGSGSGHYLERSGAGLIRRAGTEGAGSLILDGSHMKVKS